MSLFHIYSYYFIDETQTVEPTTAVAEATSSGDLDLTMQDICKAIFCRFVIRDNGTRKYKGKCSRMPKGKSRTLAMGIIQIAC